MLPRAGTWLPSGAVDAALAAVNAALEAGVPAAWAHLAGDAGNLNHGDPLATLTLTDRASGMGRLLVLRRTLLERLAFHFGSCVPTADAMVVAELRSSAVAGVVRGGTRVSAGGSASGATASGSLRASYW